MDAINKEPPREHHNQGSAGDEGQEIPVKMKSSKREDAKTTGEENKTPPPQDEQLKPETAEEAVVRLEEQVKRLSAEFENFRKRQEKRYDESVKYAAESVIAEFLPVLDSIRLAHSSAAKDRDFDQLLKGLDMIAGQLEDTMKKLGVEEIESVGQSFDPAYHHAVMAEETEQHPDQHILEEFQKGYKYKDRVIRPGMVKVARNS